MLLEPVEALRDDPRRLAHLVHVHAVAVVDVAVRVDRDAKSTSSYARYGSVAAQVPVDAGRAQHRPGLAERDRVGGREQPDPLRALEPDLVACRAATRTRRPPSASTRRTCGTRGRTRAGCPRRARRPGSSACACASRRPSRRGRGSGRARGSSTRTSRSRPARAPPCRARRGASGCGSARRAASASRSPSRGTSISSSFSIASTKTSSLFWKET